MLQYTMGSKCILELLINIVHLVNSYLYVLQVNITTINIAVLMIRVENCPDIGFRVVILLTSPLIIYSKFVWSNLTSSVKCPSWPENV